MYFAIVFHTDVCSVLYCTVLYCTRTVLGPLDMMMLGMPIKIIMSAFLWMAVQYTEDAYAAPDGPHVYFLAPLTILLLINEIAGTLIFISFMSFFSKISDPSIGGSYMTLLNTVSNIGFKWPSSLSLWLLPKLTYTVCESRGAGGVRLLLPFLCSAADGAGAGGESSSGTAVCTEHGGSCVVELDGYTVEVALGLVIGFLWLLVFRSRVAHLQSLNHSEWLIAPGSGKVR